MSIPVSVVIISFNAAATIQKTLQSARSLSGDVVVVDSGSVDATPALALQEGARVVHMQWQGYGANKNRGNTEAKHDWILSLDADEVPSPELIESIQKLDLSQHETVYRIKRLNYLDGKPVYHGEWGNDWTIRLFNRQYVHWDEAPVHESLVLPPQVQVRKIAGWLHHFTAPNIGVYQKKLDRYADLMAGKYFARGKKAPALKVYISPVFNFMQQYLIRGGWKDRKAGWQLAKAHANYTFQKYKKLRNLVNARPLSQRST